VKGSKANFNRDCLLEARHWRRRHAALREAAGKSGQSSSSLRWSSYCMSIARPRWLGNRGHTGVSPQGSARRALRLCAAQCCHAALRSRK